jgi:ribonuclease HIII
MAALEAAMQLRSVSQSAVSPKSASKVVSSGSSVRPANHAGSATPDLSGIIIGQDESGKGDYFGPLVVASCRVRPDQIPLLRQKGVIDCKQLSDAKVRELAAWLPEALGKDAMAITRLSPRLYNRLYARFGNLNTLLAWAHGRTLERVLFKSIAQYGENFLDAAFAPSTAHAVSGAQCGEGCLVVIDQFASNQSVITRQLRARGQKIAIHQQPRAEVIPAVAAASILARAAFLDGIEALSRRVGVSLHPGAGGPTMASAQRLARAYDARVLSEQILPQVAKLHFKTTQQVLAMR